MSRGVELPPLVRGRVALINVMASSNGITPARAGKRILDTPIRRGGGNYPRSCGEESLGASPSIEVLELPPLVRGRVAVFSGPAGLDGITPARAGKSTRYQAHEIALRNYPRSCGEEGALLSSSNFISELPPLVRGRAAMPLPFLSCLGITPARAGKREDTRGRRRASRELPPLVRGRGVPAPAPSILIGITPARAGKRTARPTSGYRERNYPRSCGEERS